MFFSDFFFILTQIQQKMRFSDNSVLRFYFKDIVTVHLSKNKVEQRESCWGKRGIEPKLKKNLIKNMSFKQRPE